jgi:hypothetical protein
MGEIDNLAIAVMTLLSAGICVCLPRLIAEVGSRLARRSLRRFIPSYSYLPPASPRSHHPEASRELTV